MKTPQKLGKPNRQQTIGRWGEDLAAAYFVRQGWSVLARNVRTGYGEIDLVVQRGEELVFVEVKARTGAGFGFPEEAVTEQKRTHLIHAVEAYLQVRPEITATWRIDVIAIRGRPGTPEPEITHFENAVS